MTPRERKYHSQRIVRCKNGMLFRRIEITPATEDSYDGQRLREPINDEPSMFANFAMMIPKGPMKYTSKKEMKKKWYSGSMMVRQLRNFLPKPWKQKGFPLIKWEGQNWKIDWGAYSGETETVSITKENHSNQ